MRHSVFLFAKYVNTRYEDTIAITGLAFFKNYFLIGGKLHYNVVLVFAIQQCESADLAFERHNSFSCCSLETI